MGGINDDGNATFLSTSGMNPWRDVSDWFTLDGFVGNVNPVVSATLQALGVEPSQGGPMLFPDMVYDPETGGLKADTPGFVESFIESTVPQTRLRDYLTNSGEWQDLVQRDPRAASRQLQSMVGVPTIVQTRNVPQEHFRAEVNRSQNFRDAWNRALREGTTDQFAQQYPEVAAAVEQLRTLDQSGQLDQYRS
jgi:hypothetical protein